MKKTRSKLLALLLSLSLLFALLPAAAMATDADTAAADITVRIFDLDAAGDTHQLYLGTVSASGGTAYTALTAAISDGNIPDCKVTPASIMSINGLDPDDTSYDKPAWLFTVNEEFGSEAIGTTALAAGDVLSVFFVKDMDTARYAFIDPVGAPTPQMPEIYSETVPNAFYADDNLVWFKLTTQSLNYNDLFREDVTPSTVKLNGQEVITQVEEYPEAYYIPAGTAFLTADADVPYQLIPAYIRVEPKSAWTLTSDLISGWWYRVEQDHSILLEQDFLTTEADSLFNDLTVPGALNYEKLGYCSYLFDQCWRDGNYILSRLAVTDAAGQYLPLAQKNDPLSGFDPAVNQYTAGSVPDSIVLHYATRNTNPNIVLEVQVPEGVTTAGPAGTVTVSGLTGKSGQIVIGLVNETEGRSHGYTIAFDNNPATDPGIFDYLPAPAQFVNEGVTAGGWGDMFNADGTPKALTTGDNLASTGISLGSFGGYVVLDMGTHKETVNGVEQTVNNVQNDPANAYGADFIVYGNAFWNNSEPGCIQVSQDGSTWYDIAGSDYYKSGTMTNYHIIYTNPTPADDTIAAAGDNLGVLEAVGYNSTGGSGTITTNSFHNHSWFPLWCNYFDTRNGVDPMENRAALPFVTYNKNTTAGSTLALTGVKLDISQSLIQTSGNYLFGYCDVHPTVAANWTTAYNPYGMGAVTDRNEYRALAAGTGGGNPIDISWAVYPAGHAKAGQPAELDSIRYVRIYTGAMQMNGAMGEVSTEVTGVRAVTNTGTGAAADTLTLKSGRNTINHNSMMVSDTRNTNITLTSSAEHIYVNGEQVTSGTVLDYSGMASGESKLVQIITQSGTAAPYITMLRVTK